MSGDRGKWSRVIEETNVQLDYHPAREREERESEREKEEERKIKFRDMYLFC